MFRLNRFLKRRWIGKVSLDVARTEKAITISRCFNNFKTFNLALFWTKTEAHSATPANPTEKIGVKKNIFDKIEGERQEKLGKVDNSYEEISDMLKTEATKEAGRTSLNMDKLQKFVKTRRIWEQANKVIDEAGLRVRDTPYYPEENLKFDENGRCLIIIVNSKASKNTMRALGAPLVWINLLAAYWAITNFMLGFYFKSSLWFILGFLPSLKSVREQFQFQDSLLKSIELDINGREIHWTNIFGKKSTILIKGIIKGEHLTHGPHQYYQFRLAMDDTNDYVIDYSDELYYPKTLEEILSGRNIVTPGFEPNPEDNIKQPYDKVLEGYFESKDPKAARRTKIYTVIQKLLGQKSEGEVLKQAVKINNYVHETRQPLESPKSDSEPHAK